MIKRIIIQDIIAGFRRNYVKYILYICFITLTSVGKYFGFYQLFGKEQVSGIGVVCTGILSGITEYIPDFSTPITIPITWIVLVCFIPFLQGDYTKTDMTGMGIQKILYSGRERWWIGKCMYILAMVIIYMGIMFGIPMLIELINSRQLISISKDILVYTYEFSDMCASDFDFWGYVVVMPFLCSLAIAIWTNVLGMIWNPSKAFMVMVIYLVTGIFYMHPALIGNQLMLFRCVYFNPDGIQFSVGIWIDCVLIIAGVITGLCYIERKDLI